MYSFASTFPNALFKISGEALYLISELVDENIRAAGIILLFVVKGDCWIAWVTVSEPKVLPIPKLLFISYLIMQLYYSNHASDD